MNRKDPRAPEMPWLTPYLAVRDAKASLDFYAKAFGFDKGTVMPGKDGNVMHGEMRYKGQVILMCGPESGPGPRMKSPRTGGFEEPIALYVYVDDVDAFTRQARAGGAEILSEPEDMFWGDRIARMRDPDGYAWTFATNVSEFDPEKMPDM